MTPSQALSNLDQKYTEVTFAPGIYLVLPCHERLVKQTECKQTAGVDVVLLHGLLGGVFYTWRQHDQVRPRSWTDLKLVREENYTYCWPRDWLQEDARLSDRVRVIGVDCEFY